MTLKRREFAASHVATEGTCIRSLLSQEHKEETMASRYVQCRELWEAAEHGGIQHKVRAEADVSADE